MYKGVRTALFAPNLTPDNGSSMAIWFPLVTMMPRPIALYACDTDAAGADLTPGAYAVAAGVVECQPCGKKPLKRTPVQGVLSIAAGACCARVALLTKPKNRCVSDGAKIRIETA